MKKDELKKFAVGALYRIQDAIKEKKYDAALQICNSSANVIKNNMETTFIETNSEDKYSDIY